MHRSGDKAEDFAAYRPHPGQRMSGCMAGGGEGEHCDLLFFAASRSPRIYHGWRCTQAPVESRVRGLSGILCGPVSPGAYFAGRWENVG